MTLVAGIDSSTQSYKVLVVDAASGTVVRDGRAAHPDGTKTSPRHWETALDEAVLMAGGLEDVGGLAVGAQPRRARVAASHLRHAGPAPRPRPLVIR
jgi:xylulokinase